MIKNERKMMNKETAFTKFLAADFAQAEADFKQLLQAEPEDIELRFGLALSLAQQSFFKEAAEILETLSLEVPQSLEIKMALWQSEIQLGKYRLASSSIAEAHKKDRLNLELAALQLKELRQLGAWSLARNLIDDVLRHQEQDHLGFLLETCLFHVECPAGDMAMALSQFAALSELDPENPMIAMAFAHALIRDQQGERAISVLQQAKAVGVQAFELQAYLAWANLSAGNFKEAERLLYPLQSAIPHDLIVLIVSAYLAINAKNYIRAIRCFSSVLNMYEGFVPEIRAAAEVAHKHLNNADLALSCYQKLVVVEGANYHDLLLVIWLAYSARKSDVAQLYFEKLKKYFPNTPAIALLELLLNEQDDSFGSKFMQLAPKLSAGEHLFYDYALAIYYTVSGQLDLAVACLKNALKDVPFDALLTKSLIDILIRQEKWDEVFEIGEAFLKVLSIEYELRSQLIFVALQNNMFEKAKFHERWIVLESFNHYAEWLESKWREFDDVKEALAAKQKPLELMDKKRARILFVLWLASASAAVLAVQNLDSEESVEFLNQMVVREQSYQIRALLDAFDNDPDGVAMYYFDSILALYKNQDQLDKVLAFLEQEKDNQALIVNYQIYKTYALVNLQRFDEAKEYLNEFVDFEKQELRTCVTDRQLVALVDAVISVVCMMGGYDDFIVNLFERSLEQAKASNNPNLHVIEHNYALELHHSLGRRVEAERKFGESTYRVGARAPNRQFMVPFWRGESLAGKTLLVWREQGIGDELAHVMMLPKMQRRAEAEGGKIIFECSSRLLTIFRRTFPEFEINVEDTNSDLSRVDIDYHIPLGGLFAHTPPDFVLPARFERHLDIRPDYNEKWQKRLAALGSNKKIGLAWRSGYTESIRNHYYCEVSDLLPLLRLKGVDFVMLNYARVEEGVQEIFEASGVRLHTWNDLDLRNDFEQQIALIANLDMVISPTMTPGVLARCVDTPNWVFMHKADYLGMPPVEIFETQYPALVWKKHYTEKYYSLMERMAASLRETLQLPE